MHCVVWNIHPKLSEQTSRTGNNRSHPLVLQELHEEPTESEFIFARAFGKSVSIFEPSHGAMTSLSSVLKTPNIHNFSITFYPKITKIVCVWVLKKMRKPTIRYQFMNVCDNCVFLWGSCDGLIGWLPARFYSMVHVT